MARSILNWPRSLKIGMKIFLMLLCCIGLCLIPFSIKNSVMRAFSSLIAGAQVTSDVVANLFFNTMTGWFDGFIILIFIVNLIFFIIDTTKNDTVSGRRTLHVLLNIFIIAAGLGVGFYLVNGYFQQMVWWSEILFSMKFLLQLSYIPYLAFLCAAVFEMIWDVWAFGAENRNPWILRILRNAARK